MPKISTSVWLSFWGRVTTKSGTPKGGLLLQVHLSLPLHGRLGATTPRCNRTSVEVFYMDGKTALIEERYRALSG